MATGASPGGKPGRLITFEGGEGVGKSTQIPLVADYLTEKLGVKVVQTREPGGTAGAEAIRALLVEGSVDRWSAMTECLLHFAARSDHVERVIRPALARGDWVLCDRFVDSTMAYQGIAGGVGANTVADLAAHVLGDLTPDLTLLLDGPPHEGLARAKGRSKAESRYEEFHISFHENIRNAFLAIAKQHRDRVSVIDIQGKSINAVRDDIVDCLQENLINV